MKAKLKIVKDQPVVLCKLDIGCGKNKKQGYIGIDQYPMEGVDKVMDARTTWPFKTASVDEVYSSHYVEHLTAMERVFFFNEAYRVLKADTTASVTVPHWASSRAYGDPTHQWPPVSEMFWYYLDRKWRADNAPHTDAKFLKGGFDCDFATTWGYALHPSLNVRNDQYKEFAIQFYKEAILDMVATLKPRK